MQLRLLHQSAVHTRCLYNRGLSFKQASGESPQDKSPMLSWLTEPLRSLVPLWHQHNTQAHNIETGTHTPLQLCLYLTWKGHHILNELWLHQQLVIFQPVSFLSEWQPGCFWVLTRSPCTFFIMHQPLFLLSSSLLSFFSCSPQTGRRRGEL